MLLAKEGKFVYARVADGRLALRERGGWSDWEDRAEPRADRWYVLGTKVKSSVGGGYLVYDRLGMEGIALFYGLVETAVAALYLLAFRRATMETDLATFQQPPLNPFARDMHRVAARRPSSSIACPEDGPRGST